MSDSGCGRDPSFQRVSTLTHALLLGLLQENASESVWLPTNPSLPASNDQ
jgi:hypothetical protein